MLTSSECLAPIAANPLRILGVDDFVAGKEVSVQRPSMVLLELPGSQVKVLFQTNLEQMHMHTCTVWLGPPRQITMSLDTMIRWAELHDKKLVGHYFKIPLCVRNLGKNPSEEPPKHWQKRCGTLPFS